MALKPINKWNERRETSDRSWNNWSSKKQMSGKINFVGYCSTIKWTSIQQLKSQNTTLNCSVDRTGGFHVDPSLSKGKYQISLSHI